MERKGKIYSREMIIRREINREEAARKKGELGIE